MSSCLVLPESAETCHAAAEMLQRGGVVAIPGVTNYAIVVDATNKGAVDRVYALKDRTRSKPLTLLAPPHDAELYVDLPSESRGVLCLMGDPIALVGRTQPGLAFVQNINPSPTTVGVFWLNHLVHKHLYAAARFPVAGTSLNRAGEPMIRHARQAAARFGNEIDLLIDGGDAPLLDGHSTVLDLSVAPPVVLRSGLVSTETLRHFVPGIAPGESLDAAKGVTSTGDAEDTPLPDTLLPNQTPSWGSMMSRMAAPLRSGK